MDKYVIEEALCDVNGDDYLGDEIRALSMACMPFTTTSPLGIPNPFFSSLSFNHADISQHDDYDYDYDPLQLIPNIKEECCDVDVVFVDAVESKNSICVEKLVQNDPTGIGMSMGSEFLDAHGEVSRREPCDPAQDVETSSNSSSFPTAAQTFIQAINKNRSCQIFIRNRMLHIKARMEEITELQKRLKALRDFQVQCKRKIGLTLSQKQDARVQLISVPKQRAKDSEKNVSAMFLGPLENSHVVWYKTALKKFPLSFQREKWSKDEIQNLQKEIIKQLQERLFRKSAAVQSILKEPGLVNGVDGMISSIKNLDMTPELIQDFSEVDWDQLASGFARRSGAECEARWLNYDNCMINQDMWTSDEDKHLLLLIQNNGIQDWSYIAEKLETNRTPFQCLVRYQRSLNASILKRDWTVEEDALLRSAVESFGERNWQAVASVLEGRTGTQCSNRWSKTLLPARKRVGKWNITEDNRLRVAVTLFGHKSWHRIAHFVPGRTQVQCRERWVNTLDPFLNRGKWSEDDDLRLKAAIAEHGYCWSKVAACVPLRTDSQCRRRWKVLFPEEVPVLKAARDVKKAALISNFVDRASERPALGPNDFVHLPITDSTIKQEDKNVSTAQKRKGRKADPTREFASCYVLKESGSRKLKKSDGSLESNSNCDDAWISYDTFDNKSKRDSNSGSKKMKHNRNLDIATEPKKSWDISVRIRSRRPRGVGSKEISLINNNGETQATSVHDTDVSTNTLVHPASLNNGPELLYGQSTSSDSQWRIHEEKKVEVPTIATVVGKKKS